MWYKSVNKAQFRSYVRQDTRLNVAYWTATKVVQMCELQANDTSLEHQITQMDTRVASLLNAVNEEVTKQNGLTKHLIQHQLEYTKSYCANALANTSQRVTYAQTGLEMPGEEEQIAKEMAFIKERADMIPGDDLLEEYDRAIYLIYQATGILDSDNQSDEHRAGFKKRIAAACDLMTPGFSKIQRQCNDYVGHLYLSPAKSRALINQQIVDYSNMFSAGFSLARLYRILIRVAEEQDTEAWTQKALTQLQKDITERSNTIQSSLIEANLARADNMGYVLDPELFNHNNISESAA